MKKKNRKNKKDNIDKYILIGIVFVSIFIIIINIFYVKSHYITNDEKKFRYDYIRFNGRKNLAKIKYTTVNIDKQNRIKYLSSKEVIKFLKSGTGVIYFGFPEGFSCRSVIEPLLTAIKDENVDNLYYLNAYEIRDEKLKLESGKIMTTKKGTNDYYKILDLLGDNAEEYEGFAEEGLKRLYFPTVIFVKNGKIVDFYSGTLDSVDLSKELSDDNKNKLKKRYISGIKKVYS